MPTPRPRLEEPMPTEEDLRRLHEMEDRLERERQQAIEAGRQLPPVPEGIWNTEE